MKLSTHRSQQVPSQGQPHPVAPVPCGEVRLEDHVADPLRNSRTVVGDGESTLHNGDDDQGRLLTLGCRPQRVVQKIGKDLVQDMLLRSVRRSIQRRVRGLERLFVTGDIGLARRAATELPEDSVVTARVPPVDENQTLVPVRWFPGPDQGCALSWGQPVRLVWELLACADSVELLSDGVGYRFSAWQADEMGSTDFVSPWVRVEAVKGGWASSGDNGPLPEVYEPFQAPAWATDVAVLRDRLRVPATTLMEVLSRLSQAESLDADLELGVADLQGENKSDRRRRQHIGTLLSACKIGDVSEDGRSIRPGPRAGDLVAAWNRGDRRTVFWLLAPWEPLRAASLGDGLNEFGKATYQSARSIASSLGFVAKINRELHPGGATPSMVTVKAAFDAWRSGEQPQTVRSLLVDFFLGQLQVSPSRVLSEWERLKLSPVFHGISFRRGGHPDEGPGQKLVDLSDLKDIEMPLDSVDGFRDFIPQAGE